METRRNENLSASSSSQMNQGSICPICRKVFTRFDNMKVHINEVHICDRPFICGHCNKTFKRKRSLIQHMQRHELRVTSPRTVYEQGVHESPSTSRDTRKRPPDPTTPPPPPSQRRRLESAVVEESDDNEERKLVLLPNELSELYQEHWHSIRTHYRVGNNVTVFTSLWDFESGPNWDESLINLFDNQIHRFKVNYSHSFILKHKETGELSFYHASPNNHCVLDQPLLISSKPDFLAFLHSLRDHDVLETVQRERPNSKYSIVTIPSTSFYFYHLREFPIGCWCEDLPSFLSNNKFICKLQSSARRGEEYHDNLCLFRCLALHMGCSTKCLELKSKELYEKWYDHSRSRTPIDDFPGVTLRELENVEWCYKLNIDVFEFRDLDTSLSPVLVPVRRSPYKFPVENTLRLLQYNQHFMYIIDIDKLGHALACNKCQKLWKTHYQLDRHQKRCVGVGTKMKYKGGVFNTPQSPLEGLMREGFIIPVDPDFIYPFRATFDFEAYFDKTSLPPQALHTTYEAKHVPLSVSVASNVEGFESPCCFVSNGDPYDLVDRMVEYLVKISDVAYNILTKMFEDLIKELGDMYPEKGEDVRGSVETHHCTRAKKIKALTRSFLRYLRQLPVVGFNSGKYDLNIIKPYLFKTLIERVREGMPEEMENDGDDDNDDKKSTDTLFAVKRNNDYLCISTEKLRFLDIRNFLAPGFSYSKYLQAFDVTEKKSFFPYEYIDSLERLDEMKLPSHKSFFSTLKNANITDEDYQYCKQVWETHNMKTLRDFLIFYNNKDVGPFLTALDRQITVYKRLGVDLLKDGLSVPGITLKYMFKTIPRGVIFSLFHKDEESIHTLLREQMTGGPSIIFHRYHEKGKTKIRGRADKIVQTVQGYDANALYLWAIMQPMPTEYPIIRRVEDGFKHRRRDKFGRKAREWLEFVAYCKNVKIQHKHNDKEKSFRIGNNNYLRVDGYDAMGGVVYEFQGCLFHGHECARNTGKAVNPYNGKTFEELRRKTAEKNDQLRNMIGVKVVEMWECKWDLKRKEEWVKNILKSVLPPPRKPAYREASLHDQGGILSAVERGELFGLILCDLNVPTHLRAYFSEFQPIFKNTLISKNDIGPHMKEYAEENDLLRQPRKALVGSYFAKQILVATPLLRWYMFHGISVDNVTLVLEYIPNSCFQSFGKNVSEARRSGDVDPSKKILAETYKLVGNSSYGKTITNMTKHRNCLYTTPEETTKLINEFRFQKLVELGRGVDEVEMAKKEISWDLPLQIGFFVYQYAKLRMLEFHYDFIDKFIDRADYQLLEMDTDSLYLALSTPSLETAVRSTLREQFYTEWERWLPACACTQHTQQFISARVVGQPFDSAQCDECRKRLTFDKRTPGLFKTEYSGTGFVGLCSKTYYCFGEVGGYKLSCKGLNKFQNNLNADTYKNVIDNKQSSGGYNKGFKTDGKGVFTYKQHRKALSYLYIKRIVEPDGVTTRPTEV